MTDEISAVEMMFDGQPVICGCDRTGDLDSVWVVLGHAAELVWGIPEERARGILETAPGAEDRSTKWFGRYKHRDEWSERILITVYMPAVRYLGAWLGTRPGENNAKSRRFIAKLCEQAVAIGESKTVAMPNVPIPMMRAQADQLVAMANQFSAMVESLDRTDQKAQQGIEIGEAAGREAARAHQRLDDQEDDWLPIADYYDDNYPHDDPETWLTPREIEIGGRCNESPRETARRVLGGVATAIADGRVLSNGRRLGDICRERKVRRGGYMSNTYPPDVCATACHQRIGC